MLNRTMNVKDDILSNQIPTVGGLPTPVFYPSVSSASKNDWSVIDHIELLVTINYPQFLVSALDVYKHQSNLKLMAALSKAEEQCQVVLFDSGIYEVTWCKDTKWCIKRYVKTLKKNRFSHAFDFDVCCLSKCKEQTKFIKDSIASTISQLHDDEISPIIHCNTVDEYIDTCLIISRSLKPKLLAMPEKKLGNGIMEISKNILKLRNALSCLDYYQQIHILGTGNPLSMMAYYFAGADSFDGLDWCQTCVDYKSATLHHTLHLDFYKHQNPEIGGNGIDFLSHCYLHNLEFYDRWTKIMRECKTSTDKIRSLKTYFAGKCLDEFLSIFLLQQQKSQ